MTIEQARELMQLELWKGFLLEIESLILFEEKKFRTCKPEEVARIQEKILAYESVKNLPQNVIDRETEE